MLMLKTEEIKDQAMKLLSMDFMMEDVLELMAHFYYLGYENGQQDLKKSVAEY